VEDTVVGEGGLRQVITLAEIGALLEALAPGRAVTLVLDSCSSGTPPAGATHTLGRLRGTARLRDGDTLIAATAHGQVGVEIHVDGAWRGALTWALCTAAAPYARKAAHGFVVPDLSLAAWVDRARLLLRGVSVSQRPQSRGDGTAVVLQPTGVPPVPVTFRLADQRRGDIEIDGDETGQIQGNEPVWMTYRLESALDGALIGKLVTSYQTPPTVSAPYRDGWGWAGAAWPANFAMSYAGTGTAGVNPSPQVPAGAPPMMAFPTGLSKSGFGTQAAAGCDVWGISESSVPGVFLAYLLRNTTNGGLKWLITWDGYSQRGKLLALLPSLGGTGGMVLDTGGESLWFLRLSPSPASLDSVVPGYDVSQAWSG
jgi:hypothetical protein